MSTKCLEAGLIEVKKLIAEHNLPYEVYNIFTKASSFYIAVSVSPDEAHVNVCGEG